MVNQVVEDILNEYQEKRGFSDKVMTFFDAMCCFKSRIETEIDRTEDIFKYIEEETKRFEPYFDTFEKVFEGKDVKDYQFQITQYYYDTEDFDDNEVFSAMANITEVIMNIFEYLDEDKLPYLDNSCGFDEYGLDNSKFVVESFKRNKYNFYAYEKEYEMKDLFQEYGLDALFELKESEEIKKEFKDAEISSLKKEIISYEQSIEHNKKRLLELEQDA